MNIKLMNRYERKVTAKQAALTVALIVLAVFFIYPLIFVIINSFRPNSGIIVNPTGLPNYKEFAKYSFKLFNW